MLSCASFTVMNFKLAPQLLAGLLGDFSAGQGLGTADRRHRIAELLRGEDAWIEANFKIM